MDSFVTFPSYGCDSNNNCTIDGCDCCTSWHEQYKQCAYCGFTISISAEILIKSEQYIDCDSEMNPSCTGICKL